MKRFKGFLGVFLIFFLGVVFGALLASGAIYAKMWGFIESGPETVAEFTVQRLNDELKLDDLQKREFQRIADRTRLKLRSIRYRSQPEIEAAIQGAEADLRAILNPKQQGRLEDLMKRFRNQWRAEAIETPPAPNVEKADASPLPPPPP